MIHMNSKLLLFLATVVVCTTVCASTVTEEFSFSPDSGLETTCASYPLLCPHSGYFTSRAPDKFDVLFQTSVGPFTLHAIREWAPYGVDRLWALVRAGFYDDTRFYRVLPGFVAQFGTSGSAAVSYLWRFENDAMFHTILPDDTIYPGVSNFRGTVSYSCEYDPNTRMAVNRTTELYINYANNSRLDAHNFAPIGYVDEGDMVNVVDRFYAGYGEMQDVCADPSFGKTNCTGPWLSKLYAEGNSYLVQQYPRLSYTIRATVSVPLGPSSDSPNSKDSKSSKETTELTIAVALLTVCLASALACCAYLVWRLRRITVPRNAQRLDS